MQTEQYDAIVVGSGITGGWAAKELCEKGLKVLMLERGQDVKHIQDYMESNKPAWEYPHRGAKPKAMNIAGPGYASSERNPQLWCTEKDNPYISVKKFDWATGYHVGGRSLLWSRQSYRWSDLDFEANAKDGIAVDWPIRYKDLAPWYDYVEAFAGISGSIEGLPQLPDGKFMPPMELNCVEKAVAARIKEQYKDLRRLIIGRTANITKALPGRTACQYRNMCANGCPFGGYFSTQSSTLPAAMKTNNLTLRPFSIVTRLLYDKDKKKATGVEVLDAETKLTYTFRSKIIFLCASAFNSTWVLMNSATDVWPEGLGSSSQELGHNVMDHHTLHGASGMMEGYDDKYVFGHRPNGFYIPRFRNLNGDKRPYLRGFGYQGGAGRSGWSREVGELMIGGNFKDALCEPGQWSIGMGGFGEMLPYHDCKISLDKEKKDKWGLPVLAIDSEIKDNEKKMRIDMVNDAMEMLEKAGVKNVHTSPDTYILGQGIHEMGTARMGRDPKTSVLNGNNQVWDAPNVFLTDGACMTSSACQNPSLTYMAMTARAADFAARELKKGNLV